MLRSGRDQRMKNVFTIFINDLWSILRQFFAFVIAIAVCVIPALYAWFNIFSNWDPYGGTGNISIALVSRDKGYTLESGEYRNEGKEIVEEMAASTSIHWVPTDYEEAMEGVRSGKYYGALVLGENLTRNMYRITEALYDQTPSITFWQNAKTNAIANKITETAASTAEHNIQVRYLGILIDNLFTRIDEFIEDIDTHESVDDMIRLLTKTGNKLGEYCELMKKLQVNNIVLGRRMHEAGDNLSNFSLEDRTDRIQSAKESIAYTEQQVLERVWDFQARLAEMQERLSNGDLSEAEVNTLIQQNNTLIEDLKRMKASLPGGSTAAASGAVYASVDHLITELQKINAQYEALKAAGLPAEDRTILRWDIIYRIGQMRDFVHNNLEQSVTNLFGNMVQDLDMLKVLLESIDDTVGEVPPVLYAADGTLNALNGTLQQVEKLLKALQESVSELTQRLQELRDNETLETIIEMLHGDPDEFAAFFASPVIVETQTIYPINSYGTAMAPFYSTLALWVGCVVLAAVIKVEADPKRLKLRHVTDAQLYWGRFLTYWFFGQIQSAIIVWGDLHILGCQCLHPGLFYFAGSVTSFVFVCLIYSLVLVIGDVGKAVVVVVMIVQIAGSSGSYPIEILPEIFTKIYVFFPYPYAINAMRETICGMYRYDYWKYLGQLLIFGAVGLMIGLGLRRPLHGVNEFVEEEMHESGVL